MEKRRSVFKRWKAKHWDLNLYTDNGDTFFRIGLNRPPLRKFWEAHKLKMVRAFIWLLTLIAGGIITKLLGLA